MIDQSGASRPQSGNEFYVNDWCVEPDKYRITRNDQEVKLEPKVMDILILLSKRSGQTVTREEIQKTIWPGMIVGYHSLTVVIQKLRKALGDDSKNPRIIETLSKKGYRLTAKVDYPSASQTEINTISKKTPFLFDRFIQGNKTNTFSAIGLGLLGMIVMIYVFQQNINDEINIPPIEKERSIAVLPFENNSQSASSDYFVNGMTNDLITDLSKVKGLTVISRQSSFNYNGIEIDLKKISNELKTRYIVHGNMRRESTKVRINAYLVDTRTGNQLWADRYDGDTKNIFSLQDSITSKIVSALKMKLSTEENENIVYKDTNNLQAYELFLLGQESAFKHSKESTLQSRELFEKAIKVDPSFARAYAAQAWTHIFEVMNGWSKDRDWSINESLRLSSKALSLRDKLPLAYFSQGLAYRAKKQYTKALISAERAIAIDPNNANAHVLVATLLYYTGKPEQGLERMLVAIRLNPHHPFNYSYHLGQAYFVLKHYKKAIEALQQGLKIRPNSERLHLWLAATYAQSGQIAEAKWEIDRIILFNPEFSIQKLQDIFPFKESADLQHFLNGLKLAGLKERDFAMMPSD